MTTLQVPRPGDRIGRFLLVQGLARAEDGREEPATFLALDLESLEERVLQLPRGRLPWEARTDRQLATATQIASPFLGALLSGSPGNDDGGRPRFVSAWVPGCRLSTLLQDGAVECEATVKILWGLGMALSTLHASGLVHGDLHPDNVILTPGGEVVLVGFLPAPFSMPATTLPDTARGWRYAAPEWHQERRLDDAGDVYSLGLIAYELFTGKPLLPRAGREQALRNQTFLQKALRRTDRLTRKVPEGLDEVLRAMLQLDPDARPRGELDFTGALLTVLPTGVGDESLARLLGSRLRMAVEATRELALAEARRAVHAGNALAAAGAMRRLGAVAEGCRSADRVAAAAVGRDVLWTTLIQHESRDRTEHAAACLEVLRAAEALDVRALALTARVRLEALLHPGEPMASLLTGPPQRGRLEAGREQFRLRLAASPEDEDALLCLALVSDGVAYRPEGTLAEARAGLLEEARLYSAATFHRARDLALFPGDARTLTELAELARRASREARGKIPSAPDSRIQTAPPPLPRRETDSVLDDLLAVLEEVSSDPPSEPPPPAAAPPELDDELLSRPAVPSMAEAEALMTRGSRLVEQGRVAEAAETFGTLLARGRVERERFHGAVCREVRRLIWTTLLPGWKQRAERIDEALARILELVRELELEELVPLCERLLLSAIPAEERDLRVARLLAAHPTSVPFLQAAAAQAQRQGDHIGRASYLTSLGWGLLERGEITPASRYFMEAKALGAESRSTAEGLERVFEFAETVAQAGQDFRAVEERLAEMDDPRQAGSLCEEFLAAHPDYLPALERRQSLALRTEDRPLGARLSMELAERALLRGEMQRARVALRDALRMEPELDQALLYLAALDPPGSEASTDLVHFRIQLLCREQLFEAGIQLAHRQLTGGAEDLPVHELLVLLCRQAGRDPTPHLLALGRLALEDRDHDFARRYFQEALAESRDTAGTVAGLLATPGIERVFPREELASLAGRPGTAPPG